MAIAIIGAGVAGLSSSIFLRSMGYEVHVFEREPIFDPIGSGILLQPSGLAVLENLGVLDICLDKGAPISGIVGCSPFEKRTILDANYSHWSSGAHALGIHRETLLKVLYKQARKWGVVFHFGKDVCNYDDHRGVSLKFSCGQTSAPYEALIIAAGRGATLQYKAPVAHKKKPYEWAALWATVNIPPAFNKPLLKQWYNGSHQMLGVLPIGEPYKQNIKQCSVFWSVRLDQYRSLYRSFSVDEWKRSVRSLTGEMEPLLDLFDSEDQFTLATYTDIRMSQWHRGCVLAIGDCAHSMSPQLGQGANMALTDAQSLFYIANGSSRYKSWESKFAAYSDYQRKHTRLYQSASRLLTPFFQSESQLTSVTRDIALQVAQKVPLARKYLTSVLVGGRYSWLRSEECHRLYYWDGIRPKKRTQP